MKSAVVCVPCRWAVEGKIGDELIGGMVHEMNVSYIISDLKLPPVSSKEVGSSKPSLRLASSTLPYLGRVLFQLSAN